MVSHVRARLDPDSTAFPDSGDLLPSALSMAKMRIEAALLQRLAETAADKVRDDLGIEAECVYLGQATGPESNRSYIREPQEWNMEKGFSGVATNRSV